MRIINVLRNSFWSILSYILIGILSLIVRKFFVQFLQVEFLGLEGLFSNVISILSLAEMGVSTVISYGLYKDLVNKDTEDINLLMNIYRTIYKIIGSLVFLIGIVLFFFLPFIVKEDSVRWDYVQLVYVIQMGIVLSSYFLAYKRTLYMADQKDYVCVRIDLGCSVVKNIVMLISIMAFRSYAMYAISALVFNVIANVIISNKAKKDYTYLKVKHVSRKEMKERSFFKDIGNFIIHKIANIVYSGTDSIVITLVLGLRASGIYSNYLLIDTSAYGIIYRALKGVIPSVGNLVYESDKNKIYCVFRTLDFMYCVIGGFYFLLYYLALQPFTELLFGKEYLLADSFVFILATNQFIGMQFQNTYNFRSTFGKYENDKKYMVLSAVTNLLLSVLLVRPLGITGVIIGTVAGLFFILLGRIRFVYRIILERDAKSYIGKHVVFTIVTMTESCVIVYLLNLLPFQLSYISLVAKCLIAALSMIIVQIAIFHKTEEYKLFKRYVRGVISRVKSKN